MPCVGPLSHHVRLLEIFGALLVLEFVVASVAVLVNVKHTSRVGLYV
jgi:hypothetical protein